MYVYRSRVVFFHRVLLALRGEAVAKTASSSLDAGTSAARQLPLVAP